MNQIIIVGNLGGDPEIRNLEGGTTVGNLTVAVTEKFKNKSGETIETTEWFRVIVWNRLAEFVGKFSKKGCKVLVIGKIKTRSYEKDGTKHSVTELHAERIEQLTWPKEGAGEEVRSFTPAEMQPSAGDDLPF